MQGGVAPSKGQLVYRGVDADDMRRTDELKVVQIPWKQKVQKRARIRNGLGFMRTQKKVRFLSPLAMIDSPAYSHSQDGAHIQKKFQAAWKSVQVQSISAQRKTFPDNSSAESHESRMKLDDENYVDITGLVQIQTGNPGLIMKIKLESRPCTNRKELPK